MPLYYNAADLLLHPSSSEGSPNVIKEAMACNLPVLATPVGDIPELLKGVQVSSTCEPRVEALAEAIVRLIREGRRSNGRESIGPFRVEASTEKTLACYRTLGVRLPGDPD
jgi:glycosyltransferase involved in cell wall biosynthesis